MKKFLVHYHAPAEVMAQMATATPAQKSEGMKQWMAWHDKIGDQLVDFGTPLGKPYRLNSDGTESSQESELTGYSFIQAENFEEAKALLNIHPHLKWADKMAIEVFECHQMEC